MELPSLAWKVDELQPLKLIDLKLRYLLHPHREVSTMQLPLYTHLYPDDQIYWSYPSYVYED